ncbi:MAG: ethylbenzene dehydrogenase-related protein [Fidelibacterota bacterium]
MKKLPIIAVVILLFAGSFLILNCEGPEGPQGPPGPKGESGQDLESPTPSGRVFSLVITNNGHDHNGNPTLYLTFDKNAKGDQDTIVSNLVTYPPEIDGEDGGTAEWGPESSTISLTNLEGPDNGIYTALVRSAYDRDYVYFLVKWDEVDNADFDAAESREKRLWTYDGSAWSSSGDEDRVFFMWEIKSIKDWDKYGCIVACHEPEMRTNSAEEVGDIWHWKASRTDPAGYLDDKHIVWNGGSGNGRKGDQGTSSYIDNKLENGWPRYMHKDGVVAAVYPFWYYDAADMDSTLAWGPGSTVAGEIIKLPTGSRADVLAKGKYSDGTWTLEIKRLRNTGNGDDAQF